MMARVRPGGGPVHAFAAGAAPQAPHRLSEAAIPGFSRCDGAARRDEGSRIVPYMTVGATDARFFRRLGTTSYGFGLFSEHLSFEDYGAMFHGDDERVDVESLRLSTDMWQVLAHDLLAP